MSFENGEWDEDWLAALPVLNHDKDVSRVPRVLP